MKTKEDIERETAKRKQQKKKGTEQNKIKKTDMEMYGGNYIRKGNKLYIRPPYTLTGSKLQIEL